MMACSKYERKKFITRERGKKGEKKELMHRRGERENERM